MSDDKLIKWIRQQIILDNPSVDVLFNRHAESNLPSVSRKVLEQAHMKARNEIVQRWGVPADELPRNNKNQINLSSMIRLYLDKYGFDHTEGTVRPYFEADGMKVPPNRYSALKCTILRHKPKTRTKRKVLLSKMPEAENKQNSVSNKQDYEKIESRLDDLLREIRHLENDPLFSDLLNLRRKASAAILVPND